MIFEEAYITVYKIVPQKPLVEVIQELCEKAEPKPLYCELPDDLRLRSMVASGTVQTYTYTNSLATLSGVNTSTTTY